MGKVQRLTDDREIVGGDDGFNAGQSLGLAGVDGQYPSMGVGAPEYLAMKGPTHVEVSAEAGTSCYLIQTVVSDGASV